MPERTNIRRLRRAECLSIICGKMISLDCAVVGAPGLLFPFSRAWRRVYSFFLACHSFDMPASAQQISSSQVASLPPVSRHATGVFLSSSPFFISYFLPYQDVTRLRWCPKRCLYATRCHFLEQAPAWLTRPRRLDRPIIERCQHAFSLLLRLFVFTWVYVARCITLQSFSFRYVFTAVCCRRQQNHACVKGIWIDILHVFMRSHRQEYTPHQCWWQEPISPPWDVACDEQVVSV